MSKPATALSVRDLNVYYGQHHALKHVSMEFPRHSCTALIGPSGCGKSTLLRCLNRMNDLFPGTRVTGEVEFEGENLYAPTADPVMVRFRIGMVFQKPNVFPKSIYENVAFGPKLAGYRGSMKELVEQSLRRAALWDEVKNRLHDRALSLSGGQQQRLCIARALAVDPPVLLMDEPTSALDPIATAKIEDLIAELKSEVTIIIVTHNMQQAARIADQTAFMLDGELVEYGPTTEIFHAPKDLRTERYITGRFG
jgi:phosphate transport system ATP-binding protein